MSSYQYEDDDVAKTQWKRQLLDARQGARDALAECAQPDIHNWNAVNVPELVQFLHAQTMDYYRHIRPKRKGIRGGKWDETLAHVHVPEEQTVDGGLTDWYGNYDVSNVLQDAEWTKKPVNLESLQDEWQQDTVVVVTAEVTHRATGERIADEKRFQLHLPPAACEAVIAQLDDCLEDLGWIPEAAEISIGEDDIEVHR